MSQVTYKLTSVGSFFAWLAAFWSYTIHHSVLLAILHFIIGPIYVAYRIAHILVK